MSAFADAAVRGRPAEPEITMNDVIEGTLCQRRVELEREVVDCGAGASAALIQRGGGRRLPRIV